MRKQLIVIGIFIAFFISGAMLLDRFFIGEEFDVEYSLDKMTVKRNESLVLRLRNDGVKNIEFGQSYELFRLLGDGTLEKVPLNITWIAVLHNLLPGQSWSQEIYTDLEPGRYVLVKEIFSADAKESSTYSYEFRIVLT